MLIRVCMFLLKSVWVLIDFLVTKSGPNWTWCTPFGLNWWHLCMTHVLCLILCSGPLPRSCTSSFDEGRPAGLGILPFWLNFVYVVFEIKYSPKLVELVNFSGNYSVMVLKLWNSKECWRQNSLKTTTNTWEPIVVHHQCLHDLSSWQLWPDLSLNT